MSVQEDGLIWLAPNLISKTTDIKKKQLQTCIATLNRINYLEDKIYTHIKS